jgi:hypothetical protein
MHTLPAGPRPCLPPLSRSGLIPPPHLPCLHVTPSPDSPSHPPTHTSTRPWTRPLPHPHTRPHAPSLRLFPSRALVPFRRPGLSFLGVLRLWLCSFPLISGGSSQEQKLSDAKKKEAKLWRDETICPRLAGSCGHRRRRCLYRPPFFRCFSFLRSSSSCSRRWCASDSVSQASFRHWEAAVA